MTSKKSLLTIYKQLFAAYGAQRWWPGDSPFEVMVGAVLTQNTAWTNVEKAIANLKAAEVLSPHAIIQTHPRRLASWLRPSGYFNIKAKRVRALCHWLLAQGGVETLATWSTAELRASLLSVHGIGPETADDILLYAFQRPVFVIDAYTRRLFSRLEMVSGNEDYEVLRYNFEQALPKDVTLFNEYHALIVLHAKNICRTRPLCHTCTLSSHCALGNSMRPISKK